MDELAAVLRRERDLLDQLRFRFVETRLLLAAREIRYLRWATAEVDQARQRAQAADLLRAANIERHRPPAGRSGRCTLRQLANASQGPWDGILRDHHEGLCALVAEIEVIGHRNAELARSGIRQLAEASPASPLEPWLAVAIHGPGRRRTGARPPCSTSTRRRTDSQRPDHPGRRDRLPGGHRDRRPAADARPAGVPALIRARTLVPAARHAADRPHRWRAPPGGLRSRDLLTGARARIQLRELEAPRRSCQWLASAMALA